MLTAVFFGSAILCLPLLGYGFSFDQGVFSAIADTMLHGGVAYRDAWEHKPPGVFFVYYLSFLLIHREIWAVRLVELGAIAGSSVLIFALVRRRCGSTASGAMAAVMLPLYYLAFGDNTAQPESFQIPLLLGALVLWPEAGETRSARLRCFASGVLVAAAVLFKTPAVLFAGLLVGERLLRDRPQTGIRGKLELSGMTILGMLLPPILLLAYYSCRGAGASLIDALWHFPLQYVATGPHRSPGSHVWELFHWTKWMLPLSSIALVALGVVRGGMIRGEETLRWGCFLLVSLATVVIQNRYFEYHFLPVVPAVAWGAGLLFSRPSPRAAAGAPLDRYRVPIRVLTALLVAVTLGQSLWVARSRWSCVGSLARFDTENYLAIPDATWAEQREVARQIRSLTAQDDPIVIWGDQPLVYVLADRRIAGRNCHLMQIAPPWGGSDRMSAFLSRLSKESPRLILVTPDHLWWRNGQSAAELLKDYPEMEQFLKDSYVLSPGLNGYAFWIRPPHPSQAASSADGPRSPAQPR